MNSNTALRDLIKKIPAADDDYVDCDLPQQGSWPGSRYRLQHKVMLSIAAALGANRPLLVRGEPGVGKSHLARAVAALLTRHFISFVVQPYTEYQDLLWSIDHTRRLGEAQLLSHARDGEAKDAGDTAKDRLAIENFICPGPLWWAFDYVGKKPSSRHAYTPDPQTEHCSADNGVVLLIDEIDKADISLCNGLLEALGNGGFSVPEWQQRVVVADREKPPLVVITSNDNRQLPAAFLRRCVLLDLALPAGDELVDYLVHIGSVHHPGMRESVRRNAAKQIVVDRAQGSELARSGQAEYLDLLQTLSAIGDDPSEQDKWLLRLGKCFLKTDHASAG